MNKLSVVGMFVAVFCLGVVACNQSNAQPTKWEYHVVNGRYVTQDQLNVLGKDGWELVSVQATEEQGTTVSAQICYFKRPLAR